MIGVAQPHQRCEERALAQPFRRAPRDFAHQHAVGEHWQVMAVLFERRDGEHDGRVFVERLHCRPIQIGELHRELICGSGYSGRARSASNHGRLGPNVACGQMMGNEGQELR